MYIDFLIRIGICLLLSICIGLERQYRNRVVGLRTNVLVGLGAFMFNYVTFGTNGNVDFTRMAAAIVSGIGFLGAGIIVKDDNKVKGLNTAATLWCVASIGVLTSSNMIFEAIIGTVLVLLSNIGLRFISFRIMNNIKKKSKEKCVLRISCNNKSEVNVRKSFSKYIEKHNLDLAELDKDEVTKDEIKLNAVIITSRYDEVESLVKMLSADSGVTSISWKHSKYIVADDEDSSLEE